MAQLLATFLSFQGQELNSANLNERLASFQKPYNEEQRDAFNKILEEKQRDFEVKEKAKEDVKEDVKKEKTTEEPVSYAEPPKKPISKKPENDKQDSIHKNVKQLVSKSTTLNNSVNELKEKMKKLMEKSKPQKTEETKKPNLNVLKELFADAKAKSELAVKLAAIHKERKDKVETGSRLVKGELPVKKNIRTVIIDLRDKAVKKEESSSRDKNISIKSAFGEKKKASPKTQDTKIYTDTFKGKDSQDNSDIKLITRNPGIADSINGKETDTRPLPVRESIPLTRLSETIKNEMVKHTGIIIKNGNSGEINLVLKPESLGKVRVKLSIEDNNLVGKIFVDNKTVKEIVEGNMDHLKNSFSDKGYANSMIEVFVQGEGTEQAEEGERQLMEAWYPGSDMEEMEGESVFYEEARENSSYVNIVL